MDRHQEMCLQTYIARVVLNKLARCSWSIGTRLQRTQIKPCKRSIKLKI